MEYAGCAEGRRDARGPSELNLDEVWSRFHTPCTPASRGRRIKVLRTSRRALGSSIPCFLVVRLLGIFPAWTLAPGPWPLDPGPWTLDPGPWTLDPGPWALGPGPLFLDPLIP